MSWKTLCSQIDPSCRKRYFNKSEYKRIKKDSLRVNATDLYAAYGNEMTYQEFYTMLKPMLYYDKYVCDHGVEFYYYVKGAGFTESPIPDDVKYIIYAMGGKLCSMTYKKK